MTMEKFGVVVDDRLVKTGGKDGGRCPQCGRQLASTSPPICPVCGSKPVERRPEDDDKKKSQHG